MFHTLYSSTADGGTSTAISWMTLWINLAALLEDVTRGTAKINACMGYMQAKEKKRRENT